MILDNYTVAHSVAHNSGYLSNRFVQYKQTLSLVKRIMVCGHGRCGKDTACEFLGQRYGLRFKGSTSLSVLPLITYSLYGYIDSDTLQECYAKRHDNRKYWYDYCNMLRVIDPFMLLKLTLSYSDILSGTRSIEEFDNGRLLFNPTHVLWINRSVPRDPTLEYDWDYVQQQCPQTAIYIDNDGTLEQLHKHLSSI